jgi:hypothetical protein
MKNQIIYLLSNKGIQAILILIAALWICGILENL